MTGVTPDELADVMADAGKPIAANTIRYHCRNPHGMLFRVAVQIGRSWHIPEDAADRFAAEWSPYETLRRTRT